jgi:hypothetical protein
MMAIKMIRKRVAFASAYVHEKLVNLPCIIQEFGIARQYLTMASTG